MSFNKLYGQVNSVVPDLTRNIEPSSNNTTYDFFGYLLLSQIETVESVSQLDKKYLNLNQKTDYLEKTVQLLNTKCTLMEETINLLKDLLINNNTKTNLKESDSLNSLVQVCGNLHEIENASNEDKNILIDQSQTNNEEIKFKTNTDCCSKFCTCGYLPKNSNIPSNENLNDSLMCQDHKELQRLFNKRVKYEVNRKFGIDYLAEHQVRELDVKEMYKIKRKVFKLFSPFPLSIKAAWNNAMNSLRQDRHQLKKRRNSE